MNAKAITLGFVVAFCATATFSQPQPRRRPPEGLPGGPGRFGPGYQRLMTVLTEEQKASLREAMEQQRDKVREVEEKLREATRDLYTTGLGRKFDEQSVREKAGAVSKLEAEMTVLRFKAFSQMRPQLSTDQIAKLREGPGGGPGGDGGPIRGELPRKRSEKPRDENGLPVKEKPSETKPN